MKITAHLVPYSSIVGAGIILMDESGVALGTLTLKGVMSTDTEGRPLGEAEWLREQKALVERIAAAINGGQAEEQVRHFKTGATYDVVDAHALFQVSAPSMGDGKTAFKPRCRVVEDGAPVTVYRNPEGMHFVRFPDEMVSPRFEKVQS